MNNETFVYATYIATTPDKLWAALTGGEFTRKYWFGRTVESEWTAGSPVTFRDVNGSVTDVGTVVKCEPHRCLSYTLKCAEDPTAYAELPKVTFELTPMDAAVKLTLKHERLTPGAFLDESEGFYGVNNGWPAILSNLKSFLETGSTLSDLVLQPRAHADG